MKILLNAMPRTASKWLSVNLGKYLQNYYDNKDKTYVIFNWFIKNKPNSLFFDGRMIQIGKKFKFSNIPVNVDNEANDRINLLKNYDFPIIIKEHPQSWQALIAIEQLKTVSDRYYTLRRRNKFEQCISQCICEKTKIWESGLELKNALIECSINPFEIDTSFFMQRLQQIFLDNQYFDQQDSAKHLYFEDIIEIKNPQDFCLYLGLPMFNFQLDNYFAEEYGDQKKTIISNYEELYKISQNFKFKS